MVSSQKNRGNIQLVKVLYCKLLTISKQLPAFPYGVKTRFEFSFQKVSYEKEPDINFYFFYNYKRGLYLKECYITFVTSCNYIMKC